MTLQSLKETIEKLDRLATPGPWISTGHYLWTTNENGTANKPLTHGYDSELREPDAAFIAFARTSLPQLLRLAEELEAKLKVAEDALEFYKSSWHYDMIGTGEQGSTMSLWEPDRELLDDGGQRATAALAEIRK